MPDEPCKTVLGVHTNRTGASGVGVVSKRDDAGHAWITVERGGQRETYGQWPDGHPAIPSDQVRGFDGSGTNVRKDLELEGEATHSRYYELDAEQEKVLDEQLNQPSKWTHTNNCSAWAAQTTEKVTGEKLAQRDHRMGWMAQTPSSLGDRIETLNKQHDSDRVQAASATERKSSYADKVRAERAQFSKAKERSTEKPKFK